MCEHHDKLDHSRSNYIRESLLENHDIEMAFYPTKHGEEKYDAMCINLYTGDRLEATMYIYQDNNKTVLTLESIDDRQNVDLEFPFTN